MNGVAPRSRVTRRHFLEGTAGVLALSLLRFGRSDHPGGVAEAAEAATASATYRRWEDLYRERWTWDRVVKGTHQVNCWYQRGCNWNVYAKDGVVFREEQSATYPQVNAGVPDYNPRGCQKGACYSARMYDAGRLRYPLKRAGARGAGRWTRVSWEEALEEIADRMIDALVEDGPGSITWDPGSGGTGGCDGLATYRAGLVLDTPVLEVNSETGDHHPGALVTFGKINFASSADDVFYSDLVLIWGGNPLYTQIPNAHFINEARYHGAHVVSVAPDYNASSIHADAWVPVNVGSDAALGLSLAQVVVEERLFDEQFLAEQTDLPLLVREDTRRFLRQSDVERGGADDAFYVFDAASGGIREVSQRTLALDGLQPLLEGVHDVVTPDGKLRVTTVFELLRAQLAKYPPEEAAGITGTSAGLTRNLARQIAGAKAATLLTQSNFSKFYHGIEMERCQILPLILCGHVGKKGAGAVVWPGMVTAGIGALADPAAGVPGSAGSLLVMAKETLTFLNEKRKGLTDEMILYQRMREEYRKGATVAATLYFEQAGLAKPYGQAAEWDPAMKRPFAAYLAEAVEKGWQISPSSARQRIFLEVGGNILRRVRGNDALHRTFLPGLDLLVTVDWRMSTTALHSDYVLPAAGWYEKDDITWATPLAPYAHPTTRAVDPYAESRTDWEFHCLLLKALQRRARERGIESFVDRTGARRRLDRVYDEFTFGGRYTEKNPEEFLEKILSVTTNLGGIGWEELKEKGFARYTSLGLDPINIGNATDIEPGETITANRWHVEKKMPWPTLTRRIQLYIDHPFYFELGEELPVHKAPPEIGGPYPLQLTGQHARWSIHASWRDTPTLLRLQRGEPVVVVSAADADARGLADHDRIRAWNDVGSFEARVRVSPSLRPGQVIINHAWEPFQFPGGRSHNGTVITSPLNPLQLAGGYFHLQAMIHTGTPGGVDRGTRIEIERL